MCNHRDFTKTIIMASSTSFGTTSQVFIVLLALFTFSKAQAPNPAFALLDPNEGDAHPRNTSDPLMQCPRSANWKGDTTDMFSVIPCTCKPGGSQWNPWTMDRTSTFVEAATEEMCKILSTANLGFPPYNLSTSALYQRPGDTTCTENPESCQNALATVTFNRGMGSPPCPIGYRAFTKEQCMIGLRMAVKGWYVALTQRLP